MDDLSGLDWSSSSNAAPKQKSPQTTSNFYPPLRQTPSPFTSGRNTPLSTQGSGTTGFKPPASKPAQDSFSNLVNFGSAKSTANLSLREQQARLEEEKRRKEEEKRKTSQAQFGDGSFLDSLGRRQPTASRTASPAISLPGVGVGASTIRTQNGKPTESDDDLFAAFSASTKVDNASHYPPPAAPATVVPTKTPPLNLNNASAWSQPKVSANGGFEDDDDDPFGLNKLKTASVPQQDSFGGDEDEDDDLLGDLGKPVDQVKKKQPPPAAAAREPEPRKRVDDSSSDSEADTQAPSRSNDPFDKAVAQLVDYGFSPENARRALTESGAGLNVQAAVNWLLDDAHRQAKEKSRAKQSAGDRPRDNTERASSQPRNNGGAAWMREDVGPDGPSRRDNRSPASADDFSKTAAAVSSNFLKTANSLWKTGKKNVQKAVADFQSEGGDPNQPKWMRSAQQDGGHGERNGRSADVTDEAMMLESGARPERRPVRPVPREPSSSSQTSSRDQSPAFANQSRGNPAPKWQQASQSSLSDPRARLSRQAVEDEGAQAYVSPARRKKTTPQPQPKPDAGVDLLLNSRAPPPKTHSPLPSRPSQPVTAPVTQPPRQAARPTPRPTPTPPRPSRQVPAVSAVALQTSTKHRLEGTAHFKRGDYSAAHSSYISSLAAIPQTHPVAIVLLCNRALTALKTGEPRQAVQDADAAIQLIGPGKGDDEQIEMDGGEQGKREMKEFYGKALSRKAEALEQMEKWVEAGSVWQLCAESGVGGPTALAGKQRCQKAVAPKPTAKPSPKPAAAKPRPRPAAVTNKSSDAVERLRAANQAAEREGDEKFALTDKVDARIAAWRDGKRDNLRALIGSLENVLWESSGWKKVGLHELVVANKVKIHYMKAIAKTHPDKVGMGALTFSSPSSGLYMTTVG